ncbi:MAG: FAD-dependent oxidoreductase, partial [Syntrophorhabdales bacterium]
MNAYDAIVVGAGPAGTTAALRMAQKGLRVLLVERGDVPGAKNMFGGMVPHCPIA